MWCRCQTTLDWNEQGIHRIVHCHTVRFDKNTFWVTDSSRFNNIYLGVTHPLTWASQQPEALRLTPTLFPSSLEMILKMYGLFCSPLLLYGCQGLWSTALAWVGFTCITKLMSFYLYWGNTAAVLKVTQFQHTLTNTEVSRLLREQIQSSGFKPDNLFKSNSQSGMQADKLSFWPALEMRV